MFKRIPLVSLGLAASLSSAAVTDAAIGRAEAERRVRILTVRRDTAIAWLDRVVFRQFFTPFPGLIDTVHTRPQLTDLKIALTPSSNGLAGLAAILWS